MRKLPNKQIYSCIYDAAGRQIRATEDGAVTRTLYDAYGRVIQQIEPDVYDAAKDGLPQTNTYADSTAGHMYEYAQNGNLVSETSKYGVETQYSYNSVGNLIQKHFDIYDYHYLADGSIDKICVDGQTVVNYSYKAANSGITLSDGNYVDQIIYANGDVESYKYNSEGTLTAVFKNGEEKPEKYWELSADLSTKLPETRNWETGMRYRYDEENSQVSIYDNLVYLSNSEPAGFYQSTQTDADETSDTPATSTVSGSIYGTDFSIFTDGSKIVNTIGELSNTYSFTVNEDGILVSDGITVGENTVLPAEYSYDDSGRNTEKIITLASNTEPVSFLQQYDSEGMLTGSGIDEITAHYTYDDSDQLIRTNDSFANYTSSYEYDSRGNMLSKKLYDYTTGDISTAAPTETITFTYANSGWKDQLTAVNGTALTYDENGNLLTYGDKTFSWCHGSRLESITDSENTYSYVYDENGTRFSKTVNGTTTQFNYVGGLLLSQKTGEDIIFFQYGAGGVPLGFVYNGVQYFYVTNQLGDVLGITDDTGDAFVMYSYDEWGNPIQTITRDNTEEQNEIAQLNPLRYRGYYYDAETGYYYLQSRYYNPEWGRFISADSFDYIDAFTRLGFNAYIYCENNPIMFVDPLGRKATNNWFEAALKVLCLAIEIDTFTRIFENAVQIFNVDFDLNEWFNNLSLPDKNFFQDLMLYFATALNDMFTSFWDNIIENSIEFSFRKLIDEPLELFSNLPKLSWDFPAIKFTPFVGTIFSFSSILDDIRGGKLNNEQGLILAVTNLASALLNLIPTVGQVLSFIGDIVSYLTEIFFKFDNGEYI